MKSNKKKKEGVFELLLVAGVAIFAIIFLIGQSQVTGEAKRLNDRETTPSYTFVEQVVSDAPGYQKYPDIYGDTIVYQDKRDAIATIYVYDIRSRKETALPASSVPRSSPQIYKGKIAYNGATTPYNFDIYVYDISRKEEIVLPDTARTQNMPSIYDNKVVYQKYNRELIDMGDGNFRRSYDLALYDLKKGSEEIIADGVQEQLKPSINKNGIAYQTKSIERIGPDVAYFYDFSTKMHHEIGRISDSNLRPSLDTKQVALSLKKDGQWDIYVYDIGTQELIQITDDAATQLEPSIRKEGVVWADNRNGNWDIYYHNMNEGVTVQVTDHPSTQHRPVIEEDYIVWQDYRNGNYDIYMATIKPN